MTEERCAQIEEAYAKLVRNRAQVPLKVLKTKFAKSYNKLLFELKEHIDFFIDDTIDNLCERDVFSEEWNSWLDDRCAEAKAAERGIGGAYNCAYHALLINLDINGFFDALDPLFERIEAAYSLYWNAHCFWSGPPENRRIWNSIRNQYWYPTWHWHPVPGYWLDEDGNNPYGFRPPHIEPDPLVLEPGWEKMYSDAPPVDDEEFHPC